jgi:hypothetical protein
MHGEMEQTIVYYNRMVAHITMYKAWIFMNVVHFLLSANISYAERILLLFSNDYLTAKCHLLIKQKYA